MTVGCRSPRPDPEVTEKSELKSIFIERSDVDLLEGSQPEDLGVEVIGSRDQSVHQRFSNLNPTFSTSRSGEIENSVLFAWPSRFGPAAAAPQAGLREIRRLCEIHMNISRSLDS